MRLRTTFVRHLPTLSLLFAIGVSVLLSSPSHAVELTMQGGADAAKGTEQATDLFGVGGIFTTITNVLLFILGAVSVIMIIVGGLRYVISGGDSNAVTAAKNTILYAIVGVVIAILAYAIVNFVIGSFTSGSGTGGTNTSV